MRLLTISVFAFLLATCSGIPFHHNVVFGVRGGGRATQSEADSDYEKAEQAIFHGLEVVEQKLEHLVEDEVNTMFHELPHHHKEEVSEKAKAIVKKGAKRARNVVKDHSQDDKLPFEDHHPNPHGDDHRVLHAVESAEKALLHAVQDEVSTLFHELDHHDHAKKTKKVVETGVKKVQEAHKDHKDHRRDKIVIQKMTWEDYMNAYNSMYPFP